MGPICTSILFLLWWADKKNCEHRSQVAAGEKKHEAQRSRHRGREKMRYMGVSPSWARNNEVLRGQAAAGEKT